MSPRRRKVGSTLKERPRGIQIPTQIKIQIQIQAQIQIQGGIYSGGESERLVDGGIRSRDEEVKRMKTTSDKSRLLNVGKYLLNVNISISPQYLLNVGIIRYHNLIL